MKDLFSSLFVVKVGRFLLLFRNVAKRHPRVAAIGRTVNEVIHISGGTQLVEDDLCSANAEQQQRFGVSRSHVFAYPGEGICTAPDVSVKRSATRARVEPGGVVGVRLAQKTSPGGGPAAAGGALGGSASGGGCQWPIQPRCRGEDD